MIPVTTQPKRGTVRHDDYYPGSLAVIKGVGSCIQAAVIDSSGSIRQTDVVQKEFNM
jgi:hypothetical protein